MGSNIVRLHTDPLRKAYELVDSIYDMTPTPEQVAMLDKALRYLQQAIEEQHDRQNTGHDDF